MGFDLFHRSVKNQKGQVAVFLVLIFQILFVFFAMAINMGLVVHDKVNLQNSTDMAAYYAAAKQAELLNEIAHVNYQLRQAYKLLTFRIRVIGSAAIGYPNVNTSLPLHPILAGANPGQESNSFFSPMPAIHVPGVCTASTLWHEYQITESGNSVSFCKDLNNIAFVPPTGGGGGVLSGLIGSLDDLLDAVREEATDKCNRMGVINWQVASRFLVAYRMESEKRIQMIDEIAQKASAIGEQMLDFRGESVYQGARKTLERNLTDPQKGSLQMKLINSLSADVPGSCSDPEYWLPKIDLFPVVTYVYMEAPSGQLCTLGVRPSRTSSGLPSSANLSRYGGGDTGFLSSHWTSGAPTTYGVEKNPWCMPYVGVEANTSPRKIFSPLGGTVTLQASSYAKPFGGRVGPWYSKSWPSGSQTSQGLNRVDPLLPARSIGGTPTGGSPADDLVNHSKYPGDVHGMNSQYALGALSDYFLNTMMGGVSLLASRSVFALNHYNHVGDQASFEADGDSLARNNSGAGPSGDNVRRLEEAGIMPDLFDLTYYSIESRFDDNFFNSTNSTFVSNMSEYYLDLGTPAGKPPYNIVQQMSNALVAYGNGVPFYIADNADQLLTGWTQHRVVDYSFPDDHFGKCDDRKAANNASAPAPSGCTAGGRSGYSVKIVSKSYLKNVNADLGGPGQSGAILNPPPDN